MSQIQVFVKNGDQVTEPIVLVLQETTDDQPQETQNEINESKSPEQKKSMNRGKTTGLTHSAQKGNTERKETEESTPLPLSVDKQGCPGPTQNAILQQVQIKRKRTAALSGDSNKHTLTDEMVQGERHNAVNEGQTILINNVIAQKIHAKQKSVIKANTSSRTAISEKDHNHVLDDVQPEEEQIRHNGELVSLTNNESVETRRTKRKRTIRNESDEPSPSQTDLTEDENIQVLLGEESSPETKKVKSTSGLSVSELQKTTTNWDSIKTLDDLKQARIRAVTSRLQPAKSYSAGKKAVYVITGQDIVDRASPPELLNCHVLSDYLCLGKGNTGSHTRDKLARLRSLVPKDSGDRQLTSAFTLLTADDVSYQASSLQEVALRLVDHEKLMADIWPKIAGHEATKVAKLDGAREVVRLVLDALGTTQLDKATHGGMQLLEAAWNIFSSVLPDKDPSLADDPSSV